MPRPSLHEVEAPGSETDDPIRHSDFSLRNG